MPAPRRSCRPSAPRAQSDSLGAPDVPSAEHLLGHERAPKWVGVPQRDQAAAGVVSSDQSRAWLGQNSHGAALPDQCLLLHVELDPLHVRQYDFGRKDRKSTRLNSSHLVISYAVFCLKKKKTIISQLSISKKKVKTNK